MTIGIELDETLDELKTGVETAKSQAASAVSAVADIGTAVNDISTAITGIGSGLASIQRGVDDLAANQVQMGNVLATLNGGLAETDRSLHLLAERVTVIENRPAGGSGGGFGPNYICGPNVLDSIKAAVRAGGGVVATGTGDAAKLQWHMNTFGQTVAIGRFPGMNTTLLPPQRRMLVGWGTDTEFVAAKGLSGSMIEVKTDHVHLRDFALVGNIGKSDTDYEAANTHGLVVNNTSKTSPTTFWTGSESTVFAGHIVTKNLKGDGLRMIGSFNRDSKIEEMHIYNCGGNGVYVACPDGMMSKVTVGSCGGYGFWVDKASNWEFGFLKAWYCEKDGFLLNAVRCNFTSIQAQDNRWAGATLLNGIESQLTGFSADSNSLNASNPTPGVHSGLVLGLDTASITNGVWSPGGEASCNGWNINGVRAYDKNETNRGFNQRYGVLVGANVSRVIMSSVDTGLAGDTHRNQTDGVFFVKNSSGKTARDNTKNRFRDIFSHGVDAMAA